MLEVFDLQRLKRAILQNSFDRIETEEINAVNKLQFSMPGDDPKTSFCKHFHYVRLDNGPLYRILIPRKSEADVTVKIYDCEHVIATLTDDVLFGQHVVGNVGVYTADVIRYVLSKQAVQRWVLYECDFNRQFEYAWENENLLAALFSIPNRFTTPYIWKFDTSVFPWRISLKAIDASAKPQFYIRAGRNLLTMDEEQPGTDVCTRLYCLGYGEGVNQLTISDVNGGVPYLLAPQAKINEYGLITRIFVDRRFEDAQSLKERGQAILAELQEPRITREFSVADLYKLTNDDLDKAELGRIARFTEDGTQTYITGITRNHDIPGDMTLTLATKAVDVASTIADLADRQRIEQVYSQGATQIYAQSVQANATESVKARLNFYIPEEMRIVNGVKVKINLSPFRSYSRATSGGGSSSITSSSGGGTTVTSSSGGGTTVTSAGGGGGSVTTPSGGSGGGTTANGGSSSPTSRTTSQQQYTSSYQSEGQSYTGYSAAGGVSATTSYAGRTSGTPYYDRYDSHAHTYVRPPYDATGGSYNYGWHRHYYITVNRHAHTVTIPGHSHIVDIPAHAHTFSTPNHTHSISLPNHTHSITIAAHTHSITIANHTHSITIPDHTHGIEQGIFNFGNPTSAGLYVNGVYKTAVQADTEMDITAYLLNRDGKINRGAWHSIEVLPNDKAYITIDMMIQGFIQSRGGNTV